MRYASTCLPCCASSCRHCVICPVHRPCCCFIPRRTCLHTRSLHLLICTSAASHTLPLLPPQVDKDTMDMLRGMNMAGLPGVSVQQVRIVVAAGGLR